MTSTYRLVGSNGTVIEFDNISYMITQDTISGLSGYPVEYASVAPPGFIGEIVNSATMLPREISLSCVVLGSGRQELEARRLKLISALSPLNGSCQFIWHQENGSDYCINVMPSEGCPDFEIGTDHTDISWECTLTFTAHDPTWRGLNSSGTQFFGKVKSFSLPFSYPFSVGIEVNDTTITNTGSAPAPVVIELNGALYQPIVLQNVTTNQTITVKKNILEGERLVIDTSDDNLSVTHYDTDNVATDALHYCSIGSDFWQLQPGANEIHHIAAQAGDTATGFITYYNRWMGV